MAVNYVSPIEMVHLDSFALNPINYLALNAYGLDFACSALKIINTSDIGIFVSYDGVTDHDYIARYGTMDLLFQINSQPSGEVSRARRGLVVYIKGGAIPKFGGWIYLIGYS